MSTLCHDATALAQAFAQKTCSFDGFFNPPELPDGEMSLICVKRQPAIPEKKFVPVYFFDILENGVRAGTIDLRIGYTEGLFYGGNIGYTVFEPFRGKSYAARAVRLLLPLAQLHKMDAVYITNNITNHASRRTCEKAGAQLICTARLPEWTDLYNEGMRMVNVFRITTYPLQTEDCSYEAE